MKIAISTIITIIWSILMLGLHIFFMWHYINNFFPINAIDQEFILFTFGIAMLSPFIFGNFYISYLLIKLDLNNGN